MASILSDFPDDHPRQLARQAIAARRRRPLDRLIARLEAANKPLTQKQIDGRQKDWHQWSNSVNARLARILLKGGRND